MLIVQDNETSDGESLVEEDMRSSADDHDSSDHSDEDWWKNDDVTREEESGAVAAALRTNEQPNPIDDGPLDPALVFGGPSIKDVAGAMAGAGTGAGAEDSTKDNEDECPICFGEGGVHESYCTRSGGASGSAPEGGASELAEGGMEMARMKYYKKSSILFRNRSATDVTPAQVVMMDGKMSVGYHSDHIMDPNANDNDEEQNLPMGSVVVFSNPLEGPQEDKRRRTLQIQFIAYMLLNFIISTMLLLGSSPQSTGVVEDRVSMGEIPQSYGNGITETGRNFVVVISS
jgi:hypothetical protein